MKAYTDLEQSKKLAEILPIESADMFLALNGTQPVMSKYIDDGFVTVDNTAIPCWSLAALLEQFEDAAGLAKDYGLWFCYDNRKSYCTKHYDNPVDACFEMILKLHKEK